MTDAELHALLRVSADNVRHVVAEAAASLDWTARQLSVLSNTYPAWDIRHEPDAYGRFIWTASLRQRVTVWMVTAGIVQSVRQADPIALAATLAWQSSLLHHGGRSRTGPI
ncbi:hypothetical protein HII36_49480 [Nonomuraea sp. NN258]|uniref:hypothetical protein n=1 Tax=Nonomuraea antri TaxID=2730852 RepID=UPI0015695BF5|nr:hypothetical protein [Nonomuraea antri]NRQ39810.1 hypothetical protein [Nonomuraea antri]